MPGKQAGEEEEKVVGDFNKKGKDKSDDDHLQKWIKDDPKKTKYCSFVSGFDFFFGHCP